MITKLVPHRPPLSISLIAMLGALFASLAFAASSQAHTCSVTEGDHCYSISEWYMSGGTEEVKGAYGQIESYYGLVPNYTSEFLDNEIWVVFPSLSETWVEGGVTFGYGTGGTETPAYFVAHSLEGKYSESIYPEGPPLNAWSGLYLDQPQTAHTWCATWSWDSKPDYCWSGFPKSSKLLQNGLEFAATTASGADNNGRSFGWAQYMNGVWHEEWNDGTTKAVGYREKPLCIVAPAPGYTSGSIAFAVPGC